MRPKRLESSLFLIINNASMPTLNAAAYNPPRQKKKAARELPFILLLCGMPVTTSRAQVD